MADLKFCASFPFSNVARQWVREAGIIINPAAISLGETRLTAALSAGSLQARASSLEDDLRDEIISYAASRFILSFMKNRLVANRMAVAEAKRASAILRFEAGQSRGYVEALAEEMSLHFETAGAGFRLPVWEYLLYTPRSFDYKLTNRELSGGMVQVSSHQRIRIMEEAVRKRVEGAPLPSLQEYPQEVKDASSRLLKLLPKEEIAPLQIGLADFPPCILKLIEDLRTSVNVPHNGRYALAIYLIKAGMTDEQIAKMFQNAPDYNFETTTYQVKYIRAKNYSMPSCASMDTWGICIADCRCRTPVAYRSNLHGGFAKASAIIKEEDKTGE